MVLEPSPFLKGPRIDFAPPGAIMRAPGSGWRTSGARRGGKEAVFFIVVLLVLLKVMRNLDAQMQFLVYLKNQLEHIRRGSREMRAPRKDDTHLKP
jgi:hypothetical protein